MFRRLMSLLRRCCCSDLDQLKQELDRLKQRRGPDCRADQEECGCPTCRAIEEVRNQIWKIVDEL